MRYPLRLTDHAYIDYLDYKRSCDISDAFNSLSDNEKTFLLAGICLSLSLGIFHALVRFPFRRRR